MKSKRLREFFGFYLIVQNFFFLALFNPQEIPFYIFEKNSFMPVKDIETDKLFYTIGEVAVKFQVNTSLIRFWEKEFDIIKPRKNKKGNRLFSKEDLNNFHIIFHLVKERGYTLLGAKQKLKDNKKEVEVNFELVKHLQKVKIFLVELKNNL